MINRRIRKIFSAEDMKFSTQRYFNKNETIPLGKSFLLKVLHVNSTNTRFQIFFEFIDGDEVGPYCTIFLRKKSLQNSDFAKFKNIIGKKFNVIFQRSNYGFLEAKSVAYHQTKKG